METLLTPSSIKLFGRVMSSLQYYDDTTGVGHNNFLQHQLSRSQPTVVADPSMPVNGTISSSDIRTVVLPGYLGDINIGMVVTGFTPGPKQVFLPGTHIVFVTREDAKSKTSASFVISADPLILPPSKASLSVSIQIWQPGVSLARIYAFSFEGALYSMPKPAIFIVHGLGRQISESGFEWRNGRSSVDQSGVVAREWEFAGAFDLVYWEYEKGDFSLRLDTDAGQFEQILLAASLRSGADRADRSGAGAEVRSGAGAEVRSGAGAEVRSGRR